MMQITKMSPLTGNNNTMMLDVTPNQLAEFSDPRRKRLVQDIFPHLSQDEREFIMTGTTPWDWKQMFGEDE